MSGKFVHRPALQSVPADPIPAETAAPPQPTRFAADNAKLALWNRNEVTDYSAGKAFRGRGGFAGTAINATYVVKRLTEEFGPCGQGWGFEILADDVLPGAPVHSAAGVPLGNEQLHRLRIRFWWLDGAGRNAFEAFGQTLLVSWRAPKNEGDRGAFVTDEDAPKKSLTDAITKAASWLGFGADVHLGLWDDNRYVAERAAAERKPSNPAADGKSAVDQPRRTWRELMDELGVRIAGARSADELAAIAASPEAGLVRQKASQPLREQLDAMLANAQQGGVREAA